MLDARLLETIRAIIHARAPDRHEQVVREFKQAIASQAAGGGMGSGRMIFTLNEIAGTEIRIRIKEARNTIQRVVSELHVCFSQALAADMKHELAIHAGEALDEVRKALISSGHRILKPELLSVDAPFQRALAESNSELDFFAAKLQVTQSEQSSPVKPNTNIHVHAPSIVQIGDYTNASLTLNLDKEAKEAVNRSLEASAKFLAENENFPRATDLKQIIDEAQTELQKNNPNNTKLYASLSILALAFGGMASSGSVYDLIINAITLFSR